MHTAQHWKAGQEFAFIPKGEGVLLVPIPKPEDLAQLYQFAVFGDDFAVRTRINASRINGARR